MPAEVRTAESAGFNEPARKRALAVKKNEVNKDGLSECFKVVRTDMYLSLAPCHLSNPINGVKCQHLDPMVMKYLPKADGVVLGYFNLKVGESGKTDDSENVTLAKVNDASPFTFMWITVDLLIWKPQVGDTLEGYIYMQTQSHIGLLIHDTFNASIKLRNIPQDWEFVPSQADEYNEENGRSSKFRSYGYWTDSNGIKIEGKIKFTIRSIYTTGKMVSIEGTLVSPESEVDAQPVYNEQTRSHNTTESTATHKRFDDEDEQPAAPTVTDIPETATDEVLPSYEQDGVQKEDSSDSDSSSD